MKIGQIVRIKPKMQYIDQKGINVVINSEEEGFISIEEAYISLKPRTNVEWILEKLTEESYNTIVIGKKDNVWLLSKKEYIREETEKIEIGKIYEGTIKQVTPKSLFVRLKNEVEVYVPIVEVSATKFNNLTKVFFKGEKINVKIIKKDGLFVWGSRKQACQMRNTSLKIEQVVYAIATECGKDAFEDAMFVEVTPNLSGVMNVSERIKSDLFSGDIVKAKIISYGKRGDFKLRYIERE